MRTAWRQYYRVWLQAEGRDRDDHEYAGQCLTCPSKPWLCKMAGSRLEAWEVCEKHEKTHHVVTLSSPA